jgi:hypothetical protein
MIPKLNLASSIAALFLFFLPWLDIQCSGHTMATQSGVQTIYGGVTLAEGFRGDSADDSNKESLGWAFLVAIAFLAVLGAVAVSFLVFTGNRQIPGNLAGVLCAVALVALLMEMIAGFPVAEQISKDAGKQSTAEDPMSVASSQVAAAMIQVKYRPALYLELVALGIPALILANGLLEGMKKKQSAPGSSQTEA